MSSALAKHVAGQLSAKEREKTATVHSGGQAKFPIPDKAHATSALRLIGTAKPTLTAAQKAKVRAKANAMLGGSK